MNSIATNIVIKVNDKVYLKDPESSDLGKRIVEKGIGLIIEIGFEMFTFKKLAKELSSSEASVYRYFESKHHFLVYLTSWYWLWMDYKLAFGMANIECAQTRLEKAIGILTEKIEQDSNFIHINEVNLSKIVIAESSKVYLNSHVDSDNKEGYFSPYKNLVKRISEVILELSPEYKFPQMLVTTIIEGAHHQRFFADHLPKLTNVIEGEDAITTFYQEMILKIINNK